MRIAVIYHATDPAGRIAGYLIADLCRAFEAAGHQVVHVVGTREFVPADMALLHVDLSVVPEEYLAFARRYPVALNGTVADVRKRTVSQAVLRPGEIHDGPVIVKTDLNHGGMPERSRGQAPPPIRERRFGGGVLRVHRPEPLLDYPVFASLAEVPAELRRRTDLVVERFLPEREGEFYFIRQTFLLGDRCITWRARSRHPVIRGVTMIDDVEIPTRPEIQRFRQAFGLDYGKIDYVEHGDGVVIIDVNKTPGGQGKGPTTVARLAPGIGSWSTG